MKARKFQLRNQPQEGWFYYYTEFWGFSRLFRMRQSVRVNEPFGEWNGKNWDHLGKVKNPEKWLKFPEDTIKKLYSHALTTP